MASLLKIDRKLRVYRLFGVDKFKRIVLGFERLKIKKNGKQNVNYHPKGHRMISIDRFYPYLSFNSCLHIMSIALIGIYYITNALATKKIESRILNIVLLIAILFNIYCIALQRYTYLRLKKMQIHHKLILMNRLKERISISKYAAHNELIRDVRKSLDLGNDYIIKDTSTEKIDVAAEKCVRVIEDDKNNAISLIDKIKSLQDDYMTYTRAEKKLDLFQRRFDIKKRILKPYALITDNRNAEVLFNDLFVVDDRDYIMSVLDLVDFFGGM